ncbi:MAG: TonB family protein [Kofleriaceae bacterium]|nr:TonB family protein [Kofleriaceae bacterium]
MDARILICVAASIVAHLLAKRALSQLPERPRYVPPARIEVRVVAREPPPPEPVLPKPPTPPEPTPTPPPPPKVVERPAVRPKPAPTSPAPKPAAEAPPTQAPPSGTTSTTTSTTPSTAAPVFGIDMESTSNSGAGPAMPVGNTSSPSAPTSTTKPTGSPPAPAVAAAHEVTKMPLPTGRCVGVYTDAARDAAIEGVVVLDLVVDEKGRARDITVVDGLSHGLTEAAITALKGCTFSPGERGGVAVPVRVRGFKIRFVLDR